MLLVYRLFLCAQFYSASLSFLKLTKVINKCWWIFQFVAADFIRYLFQCLQSSPSALNVKTLLMSISIYNRRELCNYIIQCLNVQHFIISTPIIIFTLFRSYQSFTSLTLPQIITYNVSWHINLCMLQNWFVNITKGEPTIIVKHFLFLSTSACVL